jgi:hypothetical protein
MLLAIFYVEASSSILDDCDNQDFESVKPDYAETEEERVERLNQQLMHALNQFDRCLEVVSNSLSSDTSEVTNSGSSQSSASNSASGDEMVLQDIEPNSNPSIVSQKKDPTPLENISGDNGSTPKDIPDASKDDKTMKQMRREAEAAQDPELAKRYWDAFRVYVKNKESQ